MDRSKESLTKISLTLSRDKEVGVNAISKTIQQLMETLCNIDPKEALETLNSLTSHINEETLQPLIDGRAAIIGDLNEEAKGDSDAH